jgi:probable phosphoglycerate mutase
VGFLVLVRHAPTAASREGRNLGRASDPPLSDAGRRVAARLARVLASEAVIAGAERLRLVTSPALRCRQTVAAVARRLPAAPGLEVEPGLLEIDYGGWDGLTAEECAVRDPELRAAWEQNPYATRTPGGESGRDVAARAFPVLTSLANWAAAGERRCAIAVAHNHVNRLWLTALIGWPLRDYRRRVAQDPAGYSVIEYGPGAPILHRLNAVPG